MDVPNAPSRAKDLEDYLNKEKQRIDSLIKAIKKDQVKEKEEEITIPEKNNWEAMVVRKMDEGVQINYAERCQSAW